MASRGVQPAPPGVLTATPSNHPPHPAGYRNVIGLPGGVDSPLFPVLQAANVNGMRLLPGSGNAWEAGRPTEDDEFNTVR